MTPLLLIAISFVPVALEPSSNVSFVPLSIECPDDAKIICGMPTDPDATGFPVATGGCDAQPNVTYSDAATTPTACPAERFVQEIFRTWTATDSCGASVSCMQTIHVVKNLVSFDFLPGACPNLVDRNSGGMLTTAILGSSVFDVATILPSTVELYVEHCAAGPAFPIPAQFSYADVSSTYNGADTCGCTPGAPDGSVDLVVKFDAVALRAALALGGYSSGSDVRLTIIGTLTNNCRFIGIDCIRLSDCITCLTDSAGNPLTVTVDQGVNVNFNTNPPTYSGDPDLLPYFTYVNAGPNAETWKAIFDVGGRKLRVTNNATITVGDVPLTSNNRRSPGIVLRSNCAIQIDAGASVIVDSLNKPAGEIRIQSGGDVKIDGTIADFVDGTNGTPGPITIGSCCGDITTGPTSLIYTSGVDWGGSDINIVTSCADRAGDIVIRGLVDASYKAAPASSINIVSLDGAVTIDGTTQLGTEAGTGRFITSGVTMRSRRDPVAGNIRIQGKSDVTVVGNVLLTTNTARMNYGAVAVKTGSNSSVGGLIDVRSIAGRIVAVDRAFDDSNRYNENAVINLFSARDISLTVSALKNTGSTDNSKAVVDDRGGTTGTTIGGTTTLRSHAGRISLGMRAQVLSNGTAGGVNRLTACTGVSNLGTITPADTNVADDLGACSPAAPTALYSGASTFGITCDCP